VMPNSLTLRRNISFANPGLAPRVGTSHTILSGVQLVLPGEVAWAHRHSMGALRFGIEGSTSLYTVVDGEPLSMLPNDLVLTPNWTWHDHHNDSDTVGLWLDVLDGPLVAGSLNQAFQQPLGAPTQPIRARRGEYVSERAKFVRPVRERRPTQNFPVRYAWSEVEPVLMACAEANIADPYDGVILEYVNPITGGPTLPTLNCSIQLLAPGLETRSHRHTASAVYFVVSGSGATIVGDQRLEWGPRDNFVVPNWSWHQHLNTSADENALLFCVTDEPVLEALGLSRHQPERAFSELPAVPANMLEHC
jgi:gentisate 1,2-dioxygenase